MEGLIPLLLVGISIFLTVLMIVHLTQHDIPNKQFWIMILVIGSYVGAVLYYFEIYKKQK